MSPLFQVKRTTKYQDGSEDVKKVDVNAPTAHMAEQQVVDKAQAAADSRRTFERVIATAKPGGESINS